MTVSAERICLVLRSRGIPTADVEGYKPLVALLMPHEHAVIQSHLQRIIMGGYDRASIAFFDDLGQMARGRVVTSADPILHRLALHLSTNREANTYQKPKKSVNRDDVGHIQGFTPAPVKPRTTNEQTLVRKKHYVYGSHCAFMFELDWLKARNSTEHQKRTLTIEGAKQIGLRNYDWERRLSFQLTQLELPQFTAVMFGALTTGQVWSVGNHGRMQDKFLRAKEQDSSIFLKLSQGSVTLPVRVGQEHRYPIIALALEALKHNHEHLDHSTIRQMVMAAMPRHS